MPTHLHVKSHYSLGMGTASIASLIQWAGRQGMRCLALTDLENLYGHVEFHGTARSAGVRAITGVELRQGYAPGKHLGAREGRLILLARDAWGYAALCQIITMRRTIAGPTVPPLETVREWHAIHGGSNGASSLLVLTDDAELLHSTVDVVGHANVRALLVRSQGPMNDGILSDTAARLGIASVASCDATFLERSDRELHRLVRAVHSGKNVSDVDLEVLSDGNPLLTIPELTELFRDVPQALAEADRIADACTFDLHACLPASSSSRSQSKTGRWRDVDRDLRTRCQARLVELRGDPVPSTYEHRLDAELSTIAALGLSSYFVVVADVIAKCHQLGVPVIGRGSAVGSLVVHLLGASPIDPVAHGLMFERFIHRRRRRLPDIDLDVASGRRDEIIAWILANFGAEHAAQVATIQRFQRRSAHLEGFKACGLGSTASTLDRLIGMPRHLSVHPGAVVISDCPLRDVMPLEMARKGVQITQYDVQGLTSLGFSKLDILGNHALDEVAECERWLAQGGGVLPSVELFREIPSDDAKTFALIAEGNTLGIFQLESPAMRSLLQKIPIRSLEDISAALAILRPGPASGQAKRMFIRRACGLEPATPVHAAFEERLRGTHGMLLYEEDITFILAKLGALELDVADAFRSAIIRRGDDQIWLEKARRRVMAAVVGRDFTRDEVERIWTEVVRFAAYSFCRAHALSYAKLAYHVAYFKANAPVEFGCAVLNHHAGLYPKRVIASDLNRNGVKILPPSVKHSEIACTIEARAEGRAIRLGLASIKHLRVATVHRILEIRGEVSSEAELWARIHPQPQEQRALRGSGACDDLTGPPVTPQHVTGSRLAHLYDSLTRVQSELEFLEMHVSAHPMGLLRDQAAHLGCTPIAGLRDAVNRRVQVAGIAAATRRVSGCRGVTQFLTLEDETGMVEAILYPPVFVRVGHRVVTPGPFLVTAEVVDEEGAVHLEIRDLLPFHQRKHPCI